MKQDCKNCASGCPMNTSSVGATCHCSCHFPSQPNSEEKCEKCHGLKIPNDGKFICNCDCHSPKPEEKCNGAHCKCMDIGGQCPNKHYYNCKEHNPNATPTHTSDEWEKELQKVIRGALKSCIDAHGKIEIPSAEKRLIRPVYNFLSTAIKTREEEIVKKWLELDLTNSNKENWSKELSKFGLYMQEIINKLIK